MKGLSLKQDNLKLWTALLAGLGLQIAYWYLGSPGPTLLGGAERGFETAWRGVYWALILLLICPLALMLALKLPLKPISFGLGDARWGLPVVLVLSLLMGLFMFIGARDPNIQTTYPWAGHWLIERPLNPLWWLGLYALYYLSFEFFYRGFLLRVLEPYWGLSTAIWTQVIASVLIHLGKPWVETVAAIPAGFLFAYLAVRGRSLLYPVLLHLVVGYSTDLFSLYHQGLLP